MILKRIRGGLVVAAVFLGLAAALRAGVTAEWLSADAARRTIQVLIGLMLAGYANVMPKETGRWPSSARAAAASQSVRRVGGWALWLAGVMYAALWVLAPIGVADVASMLVVASAMLVTVVYAARAVIACRRTQRSSTVVV